MRLLQDNIASQKVKSPLSEEYLRTVPGVLSRRSRYHYGIMVVKQISDIDPDPYDVVTTNPEGIETTLRMRWYLFKVVYNECV